MFNPQKDDILVWPDGTRRKVLERLGCIVWLSRSDEFKYSDGSTRTVAGLSTERVTIEGKSKVFQPKNEEKYWFVWSEGGISSCNWDKSEIHIERRKWGNCHPSKEAAEAWRDACKKINL